MKRHIFIIATALLMVMACNTPQTESKSQQTMQNNEECLICGAALEYLSAPETMQCAICRKEATSDVRCVEGHYVCDACHSTGVDSIVNLCLNETSNNPVVILEKMMSMPFCHMHGPEHHIMVGAALLTAYSNAGGVVNLETAIPEMIRRGKQVPGGVCGSWGACGASLSTGMYVSIITRNTPLSTLSWQLSNQMTSDALAQVAKHGGPRCCKRDSYLSIEAAVAFTAKHFGIEMAQMPIACTRSSNNNQCVGNRCPFFPNQE